MNAHALLMLSSITDADGTARGRVVVSGSHGGLYPGYLASKAGLRAVILNNAGGGLENAGIAGIQALDTVAMAAAAVAHDTARIGDAADMMARGVIAFANDAAQVLGIRPGMSCADAADLLMDRATAPTGTLPKVDEGRRTLTAPHGPDIVLADSASLIGPGDDGAIIITGSHGGLVGGDPARALKAAATLGVFNDAGGGIDDAGMTRLPALDNRDIPAVTVAHTSARIGDAASAWETGVISQANHAASAIDARPGTALKTWINTAFSDD
ncbi:MAG: hypothetical protein RIA64_15970 [Rhodospirillales bacterium]